MSASWPQPQNRATPKKHSPVATREAKGAPTRHLAQHSNKPGQRGEGETEYLLVLAAAVVAAAREMLCPVQRRENF